MNKTLAIRTLKECYYCAPEEILRLEAVSNYTIFYLTNNRKYMTSQVLKNYAYNPENQAFVRAHRSHLINPIFITFINTDGVIHLKDDTIIKMSRRMQRGVYKNMSRLHIGLVESN